MRQKNLVFVYNAFTVAEIVDEKDPTVKKVVYHVEKVWDAKPAVVETIGGFPGREISRLN